MKVNDVQKARTHTISIDIEKPIEWDVKIQNIMRDQRG